MRGPRPRPCDEQHGGHQEQYDEAGRRDPPGSEGPPQGRFQLDGRCVSPFRIGRQCLVTDPLQRARHPRVELADRDVIGLSREPKRGRARGPDVERAAGQQVIEEAPQAEDVGPGADQVSASFRLFGAHVTGRAAGPVVRTVSPGMLQASQAEIDQPGPIAIVDQDILGLDVLVSDPAGVEVGDGSSQLEHDPSGPAWLGTELGHELVQGQPGDVLHDHKPAPLVDIQVDDPDQIGVFTPGQKPSLVEERVAIGQVLDRHRPTGQLEDELLGQLGMDHAEDLGLAPGAEHLEHQILADLPRLTERRLALHPRRGGPGPAAPRPRAGLRRNRIR